jgi:hypothetical protein
VWYKVCRLARTARTVNRMKTVTLTLEIPDEVYAVCEREAAQTGRTVEQCVMEFLLKHAPRPAPALTDEQRRQAQVRLERYLGAGMSGDPPFSG